MLLKIMDTSPKHHLLFSFLLQGLLALFVIIIGLPIVSIFVAWQSIDTDIWQHLLDTQLWYLIKNTFSLAFGVVLGVSIIGCGLAWLIAMCEFPLRRIYEWAFMLPLAIPAYVMGFVYLGLFEYSGPIQSWLRHDLGVTWLLPNIRSATGVTCVMVSVLYPYVYMLARVTFLNQGRRLMDAAQVLGASPWRAFFAVALPMARPAIVAGLALALMETMADYGTVAIFNYDTFTTAIYKTWYGFFDRNTASQLSSLLLVFVLVVLGLEHLSRGKFDRAGDSHKANSHERYRLSGWKAYGVSVLLGVLLLCVLLIPLLTLVNWAVQSAHLDFNPRFAQLIINTLILGVVAALVALMLSLALAMGKRAVPSVQVRIATRIALTGYALPGTVLAVGIMVVLAYVDRSILVPVYQALNINSDQLLLGSIGALIFAYVVRFLAVGFSPVEVSLSKVKPSIVEAAKSLGATRKQLFFKIYLPLLRPGMLTALLLVIVEVMKEMPATLLLRPFGWDTLAVRIYEMTSEGEWERAAVPAVCLVLVGIAPVILLIRKSAQH